MYLYERSSVTIIPHNGDVPPHTILEHEQLRACDIDVAPCLITDVDEGDEPSRADKQSPRYAGLSMGTGMGTRSGRRKKVLANGPRAKSLEIEFKKFWLLSCPPFPAQQ